MSSGVSSGPSFDVQELSGFQQWKDKLARLRQCVWSGEGNLSAEFSGVDDWVDEHDAHGRIWGAFCGAELIGSVRYCIHEVIEALPDSELYAKAGLEEKVPPPIASINRFVIAPNYQHHGISAHLDKAVLEAIDASEAQSILIIASPDIARGAEHRGFAAIGRPVQAHFIDARLRCRIMQKILSREPGLLGGA